MARNDSRALDRIADHLIDIDAGRCSITADAVFDEEHPRLGEIFASLQRLHGKLTRRQSTRDRSLVELERAMEAAQNASRAKSEFVASMSHEIRTPLHAIIGMTELLSRSTLSPQQKMDLEVVSSSGKALLAIVDDILDFSKIEAGKVTLEDVMFDLHEVTRSVVDSVAPAAAKKGLALVSSTDPGCPRIFSGDPTRIRQVLANLLDNAIKFTEKGEVHLHVRVLERTTTSSVIEMTVKDTGIGIPADKLKAIFLRFTQSDSSTTREYGGTGLGLAIARRFVEMMGGRIGVVSEPGEGSSFTVAIPLEFVDSGEPFDEATRTESGPLIVGRIVRVLLAEDDPTSQQVASRNLEKLGCEVTVVANGFELLEKLADSRYDLILMDCQMPLMDGFRATAAVRELESPVRDIPIIALTAGAMSGDRDDCIAAGMDDFLSKPLQRARLRDMLMRWVKQ